VRVARLLSSEGSDLTELRSGYRFMASDGVYGETDYVAGERVLITAGIAAVRLDQLHMTRCPEYLRIDDLKTACELLLADYLTGDPPPWLAAAVAAGDVRTELIPTEALTSLSLVVDDWARLQSLLISAGGEFDPIALKALGDRGEAAVLAKCRAQLAEAGRVDLVEKVTHISRMTDRLGYDISAPDLAGVEKRLEVKTIARSRHVPVVFLTRNEADTGLTDQGWRLVVCQEGSSGIDVVGYCRAAELARDLPTDSESARWVVARLIVRQHVLAAGLPLEPGQ
jgi:hypothetical protein